jgi:cytochrome b561
MLAVISFISGNHMRTKYTGLQIGIHWLVFMLVIVAYCAMEFRAFSREPLVQQST